MDDMKHPVIVTKYNPQWPALYEEEKARILGLIGDKVVALEHVGSTAVPGLGAKPIIDIMVTIHRLANAEGCIRPHTVLGYRPPAPEAIL